MKFVRSCLPLLLFAALAAPGPCAAAAVLTPEPAALAQAAGSATAAQLPPAQPAYHLPPEKLAKAIALDRIRNTLGMGAPLWGMAVLWLLLATRAAAGLETWAARQTGRRWLQGALFFAALLLITTLANLPLGIYAHRVSLAYGISVQGWAGWAGDEAKALGLTLLAGVPLLLLFHWVVRVSPRRFWLWIWLITLPLTVLGAFVTPLIVDPLFNKFEPLAQTNPALVAQLEKVVARTGIRIPPSRMYRMKASAKTNGLNAYVTGIGASQRIVVWDTTAGRIPNDEILFIFSHEAGHYVLHHIPKMMTASAVGLFFFDWGCALLALGLARRFARRWLPADPASADPPLASRCGFVVILLVVSAAGFVLEPVGNAVSRHYEHQADVYGQEALHGIVPDPQATAAAALEQLGEAWLESPQPNPFFEFWLDSHPSTQFRADFALHYNPWANGGRGEFFAK